MDELCIVCFKQIKNRHTNAKSCSLNCSKVLLHRSLNLYYQKNKEYFKRKFSQRYFEKKKAQIPLTFTCLVCPQKIETYDSKKKYCSPDCVKISFRQKSNSYYQKNKSLITQKFRESYRQNRELFLAKIKVRNQLRKTLNSSNLNQPDSERRTN